MQAGAAPQKKDQKTPKFLGTVRYAEYLKATTGQAPQEKLDAVDAQLAKGGDLRPFVTSAFSTEVAKRISAAAPMGDYLRPLLSGDYRSAATVAWRKARGTSNEAERKNWVGAVALALACEDQSRARRAAAFLNWVYPESKQAKAPGAVPPDALEAYLGSPAPAYETNMDALSAAAKALGSRTKLTKLYGYVKDVLPDNDVIVVGVHAEGAAERYAKHLQRTAGRCTKAQLEAVRDRLEKGGEDKPFVVSEQSKQLAKLISPATPAESYLKLLFSGDFRAAARFAWANAEATHNPSDRPVWLNGVAIAVRCNDQTAAGRAAEFLDWADGKLKGPDGKPVKTNPLAGFLQGR